MPIYVYGCQDCGAEEEHIQRFSDAPLTKCSSCGGRLKKLVTSAAFHLKGGGWYKDGYATAKAGSASDASGSGSDTSSTTTATSDGDASSKPAKVAKGDAAPSKPAKPAKASSTANAK